MSDCDSRKTCPVCRFRLHTSPSPGGDYESFACDHCGKFTLDGTAVGLLPSELGDSVRKRAVLSHAIAKASASQEWPRFSYAQCKRILHANYLPTPQEQANFFIRHVGETLAHVEQGPGDALAFRFESAGAVVGAQSEKGFEFIVGGLVRDGFLEAERRPDGSVLPIVALTFKGWERYQELLRAAPDSTTAFMAMEYKDPELDRIVEECFRPAVESTGYRLLVLRDRPKAGLIDDQMRVAIQSARFVVADVSHRNPGAYWEAGYAEGLSKPVIYTCATAQWKKEKSHFDTNHHQHVLWDLEDLAGTATRLKATIRVSVPEAKQQDA